MYKRQPLEWSGTGVGLSPGVAGLSKAATAVKVRGQLICRALNAQLGRLEYVREFKSRCAISVKYRFQRLSMKKNLNNFLYLHVEIIFKQT